MAVFILVSFSDVLIDEDRVAVGVHRDETGGAGRALVRLGHQLHALRLELALQLWYAENPTFELSR